jgi:hypothetical protein
VRKFTSFVSSLKGAFILVCLPLTLNLAWAQQAIQAIDWMRNVIIPNSDVIFAVGKKEPQTEQEWAQINESALKLKKAGNELLKIEHSNNQALWNKYAQNLMSATSAVQDAVSKKSVDETLDAGDALYQSCEDCHKVFLKSK